MVQCDLCGADENLPYKCHRCGGTYCATHRLPENHSCVGLGDWNDPKGVFDSGFDDSVANPGSSSTGSRLPIDTGPGGPLAYFRGNVTYLVLALMAVTFLSQFVVLATFGPRVHNAVFTLDPANPEYVWTWVTSIFAHSPGSLFHIVFNGIVIYFFGPLVERKAGSRNFLLLFLASGVLAGLSQVGLGLLLGQPGNPVLGASGAALAIMGVLTVLNPQLRVLLFFFIPMPLWLLTIGFAVFSVFVMVGGGLGAGGIAHMAHLTGLLIGLAYGERLRRQGTSLPNQIQFGGGGPGGPGGPGRRF
ncbi:rhomboid family intramembrane serine protease [Natronorarus salvus]|uniref:rhomboid family intramembrane serine protease n=1 Tax=Natronorarus salvus TaxID=3117733 RepID=UPI002F2634CE